ncbi:MAG TPA: 3-oxoadipate enol-lactonase, partial [Vicinamibacteria bacterium]|nr:3-oxoadipate enol-lactonase [Vicinamibacteria bacterium]
MPMIEAGELRVHYEQTGPEGAPWVVLSHSLGMDLSMWDPQAAPLATKFRVLRYDTRGHGRTT